jgi:hypothetical protein
MSKDGAEGKNENELKPKLVFQKLKKKNRFKIQYSQSSYDNKEKKIPTLP